MKPFTYEGRLVHSKYNPEREAQRQLLGSFSKKQIKDTKLLILINPGMDYLTPTAREIQQTLNTLGLYLPNWGFEPSETPNSPTVLFPNADSLIQWLDQKMEGLLLLNPLFFIHPVFRNFQPEVCKKIESSLTQLVKKHQKELLTLGYFSRRISLNFQTNKIVWKNSKIQKHLWNQEIKKLIPKKLVLAASGPSLAKHTTFFQEWRSSIYLTILPSSISYFESIGIEPDLIITTDPGYWAGELLKSIPDYWETPIAAPLTGNLNPTIRQKTRKLLFFHQQSPAENSCPYEITCCIPQINEYGTVAASALDLLSTISKQNLLIVGMDLAIQNFQHHVHPHGFDPWLTLQTSRYASFETKYLQRSLTDYIPLTIKKDGFIGLNQALEHYRSWFEQNSNRWKKQVYQIETNLPGIGFDYMKAIDFIQKNPYSSDNEEFNQSNYVLSEDHVNSVIQDFSMDNISWVISQDKNRIAGFRFLLQTAYFLVKNALSCQNEYDLTIARNFLFQHTRRWFNQLPLVENNEHA